MAIKTINIGDGTVKTYSTLHHMIERDGAQYSEAVDPIDSGRVYTETSEMIPGYEPKKYSTLSIKRELTKLNKWKDAKDLLTSTEVWDDFVLANYLSEADEMFAKACEAFVLSGIITDSELDELLPKCEWKE